MCTTMERHMGPGLNKKTRSFVHNWLTALAQGPENGARKSALDDTLHLVGVIDRLEKPKTGLEGCSQRCCLG